MQPEHDAGKSSAGVDNHDDFIVVGRVPPVYWWCIALFMGFGFMTAAGAYSDPMATRDTTTKIFTVCMASFWFVLGLPLAWWAVRGRVVADATGLHWRSIAGWKHAAWTEVSDFYIKRVLQRTPSYIVETNAGKLDLKDLTHNALLRQVVQERAHWAQAKTWEERERPEQVTDLTTPVVFEVDQSFSVMLGIMLPLVVVILPALMVIRDFSKPFAFFDSFLRTWNTIGPWWAIGMIAMAIFPGLAYGVMFLGFWPMARGARERRGQTITVSEFGITWRDATTGREIHAKWNEISDFYIDKLAGWVQISGRYVVETQHGNFDFVQMTSKSKEAKTRLPVLIQKHCAEYGLQQESRRKSEQVISRTTEKRIFSYRESEVRAVLWGLLVLVLLLWAMSIFRLLGILPSPDQDASGERLMLVFFILPMTLGCSWMLWMYSTFAIEVDELGITQRYGRRTRFIAWPDVREYEISGGFGVVRSETQTIRFGNVIGHFRDLTKFITERATKSLTRAW